MRAPRCLSWSVRTATAVVAIGSLGCSAAANPQGLVSNDLSRLRSVGGVAASPDGKRVAYTVVMRDRPGRTYDQLWIMDLSAQKSVRVGGEKDSGGSGVWSPDGKWIAFKGRQGDKGGLFIVRLDGSEVRILAEAHGTNSPLPGMGNQIAFVSSTPDPRAAEASGDPMVITRYLYKPDAGEGMTRFNDNQRLHIFVVDLQTKQIRQLTSGDTDEHSIEWSPDGRRILFRGTRRGLTDRETTMEDTHVWIMNADGSDRREIGGVLDGRQGSPRSAPDGNSVYFTVQERGSNYLVRLPVAGGKPEYVVKEPGSVGSFSVGKDGVVAYSYASPRDLNELYLKSGTAAPRKLTDLNAQVLAGKPIAEVESFTFLSNDNKYEVEAFLTKPLGMTAKSKHPLIVNIHGGPHGQNGPAFNFKNQVYAARGWATLNVNYRGSTGYGQKFADAVFGDQNGNEGQDVLYGVSAAVRRNPWIDRERMGIEGVSYGGQLTDWLITQTNEFKAAVPIAGIANLVSYNYMTYYNQYEEMEFGQFLHQGNLMDVAWERSALKHVAAAHTPTMLIHGENDNDVPIAEAEQFFIALKDVGTEAVLVRYPREGHGLSEVKHNIDSTDRSMAWYEKHFPKPGMEGVTNVQP